MFDLEKARSRSCAMDLVRVAAAFSVISVHFFMNAGFYGQPMLGKKMFALCVMRTFFSCCVPLFLVLSGYLMCHKRLERRFYSGLSNTLATYVLAGCACVFYKAVFLRVDYSAARLVLTFLDFSAADYAWYVEMYIGLFLLIPFLNLAYHSLDGKGKKDALMLTMLVLTVLPTFANSFSADPAWWAAPASGAPVQLLPRWWLGFYPVTYYFTGCYLREYGLGLKTRTIALLLALAALGFGAFNYWQSYGAGFVTGAYVNWGGFEPYVITVLLFSLLSRFPGDRLPLPARYLLWKASDLCLGAYLVSYIFDSILYPWLNGAVPAMPDRLAWFPVMVPCVFLCSMLLSLILRWVQRLLGRLLVRMARAAHTAARGDPGRVRLGKARMGQALFALCFAAAAALALWKCPYGFGSTDDAFYLTIPHRLVLGDALFVDEWHVSQMSGLLTLPFVWLYRAAAGSMDGILLASRYVYVGFHALVSLLFYARVRDRGPAAMAAALSWFLFTPFDIMAMSYNTMAMDFILLSGVLLATAEKRRHCAASGLCLAAAVLCCPYFAAAYFLYAAGVGVCALPWRKSPRRGAGAGFFAPGRLLWVTAGAAAAGALFLIYVLSACGLGGLLSSLPHIFSDPEHPAMDPFFKLGKAWRGLLGCHPLFPAVLGCFAALLLAMLADRRRKDHRAFYLILSSLLAFTALAMFYPLAAEDYYHAIMLPPVFVGVTSFLLCRDKPWPLFWGLFVPGAVYTFAVVLGSNQYFYALAMAAALTAAPSLLFLGRLLRELREDPGPAAYGVWLRRGAAGTAALTVLFLLFIQVYVKRFHCFVDDPPYALDYQLQEGPGRGIRTTEYKGTIYEELNRELQYYQSVPQGKILILNERTWCYLAADPMEYASFSAWISGENQRALDRLELYYQVNPGKVPDYIFLSKKNKFEDPQAILDAAQAAGYTLSESGRSWYLRRG